jgi:Domain of unknown function (DUF4389)
MLELSARVTDQDDLGRSRLTVFFRLLLALPHLIWWELWGLVATLIYPIVALVAVINGALPGWAHSFYGALTRYSLHLYAYLTLAANPYPGFVGEPGSYPVAAEFPPPARQNRWSMAFRWVLAIPPFLLAAAMGGVSAYGSIGILFVLPFLGWFAALARGSMPRGMRDALVYALGYTTQVYAYFFLLSDHYPSADPAAIPAVAPLEHPVSIAVDDDLARSRLTVFFRALLALPHIVWLVLWGIVVELTALIGWFAALFTGRLPEPFHRFIAAYVRYQVHVYAFLYLAANPFPGFTGAPGTYPVEVRLPGREDQPRLVTLFRLFLALPALLINGALNSAAGVAAILGWFVALFTGRMPSGLRDLLAWWLRYSAQGQSYLLLVTPRYPYSGPPGSAPAEAEPVEAAI